MQRSGLFGSRVRSAAVAGAAVVVTVGAGLVAAAPAQAAPRPCPGTGPGDPSKCARVVGIDPGSALVMRTAPRYSATPVARWGNGQWLEVSCWTTGDPDADGNGYRYWMRVFTGSSSGYVNDWYLDTGGPSTWKPIIPQC